MAMKDAVLIECDVCGRRVQHGPGRYEGRMIRAYKMFVCESCYTANWDGWGPATEPKVIEHLNKQNIQIPQRNGKGWIPRGD